MSVLLTGVGYIGAPLARRLLARGQPVVGLDNFYSTPRDAVAALGGAGGLTLLEGDVAEPGDVTRAFDSAARAGEVAAVFHLAAQPSAARAAADPAYTERANLVGARVVLEAARERGVPVVFGGSFRIYGDDLSGQIVSESTPIGRVGDLSHLSKVYVEHLARMIGAPFISVRLGVVYGRSPVMKRAPSLMTVPNLFCLNAAIGRPLRVLEDRPLAFLQVEDAVGALLAAADLLVAQPEPRWRAVNAASEVLTIGQVASLVQRLAQQRQRPVSTEGPALRVPGTFSLSSALEQTGYRYQHSMADSLGDVLDLFLESAP